MHVAYFLSGTLVSCVKMAERIDLISEQTPPSVSVYTAYDDVRILQEEGNCPRIGMPPNFKLRRF